MSWWWPPYGSDENKTADEAPAPRTDFLVRVARNRHMPFRAYIYEPRVWKSYDGDIPLGYQFAIPLAIGLEYDGLLDGVRVKTYKATGQKYVEAKNRWRNPPVTVEGYHSEASNTGRGEIIRLDGIDWLVRERARAEARNQYEDIVFRERDLRLNISRVAYSGKSLDYVQPDETHWLQLNSVSIIL